MMQIKFEQVLMNKLSNRTVEKYTVVEFCKEANIDRTFFYQRYKNICDLFASIMALQLRRTIRSQDEERLNNIFFRLLQKIKANKIFLFNIILISKDARCYYEVLRKEIATGIENYLRRHGAFSVRQVELVADGIYAIIFNWVLQECKYDIKDIYQSIDLLLRTIEKTKKISKYNV